MTANNINKPQIYPPAEKGPLSDNNNYLKPRSYNGPGQGDMQSKIMVFGIVFFIVVSIIFALAFGFLNYLRD